MKKLVNSIRNYAKNVLRYRRTATEDGTSDGGANNFQGNSYLGVLGDDYQAAYPGAECPGYYGQTDREFIESSKENQEKLTPYYMAKESLRAVPKFERNQKVTHMTGVECYVQDIHDIALINKGPNVPPERQPLQECIYLVCYADKNGIIQQFKDTEASFS